MTDLDLALHVTPRQCSAPKTILGLTIGLSLIDSNRRFLQANGACCDYLGYSLQELVGMTVDEVTHPKDRDLTDHAFQLLLDHKNPVHSYEKRYLRKDGTIAWSLTTVYRLSVDSPEEAPLFAGFIQDITSQKQIEEKLRSTKELYRSLVENIGVGLSLIDKEHRILMVNSTLARMLRGEPEDFIGQPCFLHFEGDQSVCPHCPGTKALATGEPHATTATGVYPDGRAFKVNIKAFPIFDAEGATNGFVELVEDLSAQLKMEKALEESEERFRSIYDNSGIGMTVIARDGQLLDANPAFCSFIGYSLQELKTMTVQALTHPQDRPQTERALQSLNRNESRATFQKRFRRKDGTTVWGEVSSVWVPGGRNGLGFVSGTIQDITEKKKVQARLEYLDHHDELTGLPNRKLLKDRLAHAIERARRTNVKVAVLLVGLDRFSKIVGTFDHETGNRLLCQIAEQLRTVVRQADTVARLGETAFVILLEDVASLKATRVVARNILRKVAEPFTVEDHRIHITASLGISLFPDDGEGPEKLLGNAGAAMNRAKQQGGDLFEYFIPELNARTRELLSLEAALRQGLKNNEFVLNYQPQVELQTRTQVGFEALVRWQHPQLGLVSPGDFIPIMEETGGIVPLGEWILREACRQNMAWQKAGLPPVRMAVNISPRQFRRTDLPDLVRRVLQETGHPAEYLELEITESIIMDDVDQAIDIMKKITGMGVHLAIDDFGTGYSSLHFLKRFPVDRLKVDRNFVKDVLSDANDAAIASAVVALAKTMNLEVVAEGIETEGQFAFFLGKDCRFGQGYLFSKPLEPAKAQDFLATYGRG